jgi:hypothetical protein
MKLCVVAGNYDGDFAAGWFVDGHVPGRTVKIVGLLAEFPKQFD